jgi:hypothetical protein
MAFRVECKNYDAFHAALRRRADDLKLARIVLDELAGLPTGYVGKLLGLGKVRGVGRISMGPLLQALGLKLVIVEDPEALHRIKARDLPERTENLVRHRESAQA